MQELINLMSYTFMQRAIICGIAISFCAALIGVILVLKNYSMIGHGLGEVGFASLSLAMALGLPEMLISIPLVVIAAIVIMIISQKKGESGDVTIALVASRSISNWCNNYSYDIHISDIAVFIGIDMTYLYRIFMDQEQISPKGYLQQLRIRAASNMLRSTEHSVTEIAYSCGFKDASAFCRQFRGLTGMTPSAFRRFSALEEADAVPSGR